MDFDIDKIVEEFKNAKTNDEKIVLLKKYINNSYFIWLLQKTYGINNTYNLANPDSIDPKIVETTEIINGISFPANGDIKLKTVVEMLLKDRKTNGGKTDLIIARFNAICSKKKQLLESIMNGTLFGISSDLINAVCGTYLIPEIKCFSTTDFREDFVKDYSRQGKIYRIFDDIRSSFSSVPTDGMFQCQLYYEENGIPDQKKFFSETAKKDQSTTFKCEVFDFVPLTCLSGSQEGEIFEERYKLARLLVENFISDNRISVADLKDFDSKKINLDKESYVIATQKTFGKIG